MVQDNHDIFIALYPFLKLCKLLGMAPYKFPKTEKGRKLIITKKNVLYTIVVALSALFVYIKSISEVYNIIEAYNFQLIDYFLELVIYFSNWVVALGVLVMIYVNRKNYFNIMTKINEIGQDLLMRDIYFDFKILRKKIIYVMCARLFVTISLFLYHLKYFYFIRYIIFFYYATGILAHLVETYITIILRTVTFLTEKINNVHNIHVINKMILKDVSNIHSDLYVLCGDIDKLNICIVIRLFMVFLTTANMAYLIAMNLKASCSVEDVVVLLLRALGNVYGVVILVVSCVATQHEVIQILLFRAVFPNLFTFAEPL